ncbi:MAG: hypothetical protein ACLR0N_09285 [Bilophila wadsworthia]
MRSDFITAYMFSITLPPLRERHGDIRCLSRPTWSAGISCALPLQVRLAMERATAPATCASCTIFDRYTAFGDVALESLGDAARRSVFPALHHEGLP